MSKYWIDGFYRQPSLSELKGRSESGLQRAEKKGKVLEPVVIQGRTIAKSWWGKAWCANLEGYADYGSRLDRGKRYVRSGAVIDLKIEKGEIRAKVQGSRRTPYTVEIHITPLPEKRCQKIIDTCGQRAENLEKLLAGDFPIELKNLFTQEKGLFPSPKEISFSCSCPDWARMCKHVAATLYGIGARLDENPALFFTLRGIEMDPFLDMAIANKVDLMLKNVSQPSERILADGEIWGLFGI